MRSGRIRESDAQKVSRKALRVALTHRHSFASAFPQIAEERASTTIPIYSAGSRASKSLEKGPGSLEESRSTFDPPAGVSMLVDGEMVFDEDEDDPSYPTPLFESALVNLQKGKPALIAKASDIPAATSADIGLRLPVQAIDVRGRYLCT